MAGAPILEKRIPWLAVFLVVGATTCNICVLVDSARSWSGVGREISKSMQMDLDEKMGVVSTTLLKSLGNITTVRESLGFILALIGSETDKVINGSETLSILQKHGPGAVSLLQQKHDLACSAGQSLTNMTNATHLDKVLVPLISKAVRQALVAVMDKASVLIRELCKLIKPALEQVGKWITAFGDKIQAGIDAFSFALDLVQKLFDAIMARLHGSKGANEDEMLAQTFNLFDVSNTGFVTVKDIQDTAAIYSLTALQGEKASTLVTKYDSNGDGKLDQQELGLLMNDEAIPGAMGTMLRTYSTRLSEAGGIMAGARHRDEVAVGLVQYFGVVVSKNMTKVGWMADRLTNSSLPLEFTADIMAELCKEADRVKLTTASIGKIVVGKMHDLHPNRTLAALLLLSNATFWASEGFNVDDHASCVKKVTTWIAGKASLKATTGTQAIEVVSQKVWSNMSSLLDVLNSKALMQHPETLLALPGEAFRLTEEGAELYRHERQKAHRQKVDSVLASDTSRHLLVQLLGGVSTVSEAIAIPTVAEQAVSSGIPAAPETLEFARWLASNATQNAKMYARMCFEYSGQSSNALDKWAPAIHGMVTLTQSFLDIMMKYSTPSGLEQLQRMFEDFAEHALLDVARLVQNKLMKLVNHSLPAFEKVIRSSLHQAGEKLGDMVVDLIDPFVTSGVKDLMSKALSEEVKAEVKENNISSEIEATMSSTLTKSITNLTESLMVDSLGDVAGTILENLTMGVLMAGAGGGAEVVDKLIGRWSNGPHRAPSLLDVGVDDHLINSSGVWLKMITLLKELANTLPGAVANLKLARREVSMLISNLDIGFDVLQDRAPSIFEIASRYWRILWTVYFVVLVTFNILTLSYAFWSNGFFGGPRPLQTAHEDSFEGQPFWEKVRMALTSCSRCMTTYHDTQLCFWSAILFGQIVVLLMFLISIVLCVLAVVKTFMVVGCSQAWILGDEMVCTDALLNLRAFLESFFTGEDARSPIMTLCSQDGLTTCTMIQHKMMVSTVLTSVFSILSTLVTLQLLVDVGVRHESARYRRIFAALEEEKDVGRGHD